MVIYLLVRRALTILSNHLRNFERRVTLIWSSLIVVFTPHSLLWMSYWVITITPYIHSSVFWIICWSVVLSVFFTFLKMHILVHFSNVKGVRWELWMLDYSCLHSFSLFWIYIVMHTDFFGPTDFGGWSYKLTPVCPSVILSVRQSIRVMIFGLFSKTALRIFLILCMSVEGNRVHRFSQMFFLKKLLIPN